jgi:polysaccharide export outer membrane protein
MKRKPTMTMTREKPMLHSRPLRGFFALTLAAMAMVAAGCETSSYFDPSRTGSFSSTPSTMPILSRIDVIESETDRWRDATPPLPEDLLASDLLYRMAPGDAVRVEIFELLRTGELSVTMRLIDQAGNLRLPNIGDVPAAGLTPQELQDVIEDRLRGTLRDPLVNVSLEDGRSLQFSVMGATPGVSLYRLTRSDFRLLDAIALAGGAPATTKRLYVIRRVAIDDAVSLPWEQRRRMDRPNGVPEAPPSIDIEDLIRELDGPAGRDPSPSVMRQDVPPRVDIDELEPVRAPTRNANAATPTGDVDDFIFDAARNEWVRVGRRPPPSLPASDRRQPIGGDLIGDTFGTPDGPFFAERIIEIDYARLIAGDSRMNIVVRPNDVVYIQETEFGFVYIDGEVNRSGVYTLPATGDLTLSRLIAAAGGLGALAIPERVDLTRMVSTDREATLRVNLGGIRRRTEPDIRLKPGDHIIIGTNFWALPLAVIRNGFRATYGFGFLLDRNFGNDVFGAPPSNIGN